MSRKVRVATVALRGHRAGSVDDNRDHRMPIREFHRWHAEQYRVLHGRSADG